MQQGSISHAFQATTASSDDPLVNLIDPNEQTTNDIGFVSQGVVTAYKRDSSSNNALFSSIS